MATVRPALCGMALVLLASAEPSIAPFKARVIAVHDGDTVTLAGPAGHFKVRLEGIDCPELGQPFSRRARQRTVELTLFRDVIVLPHSVDTHGRLIARLLVGSTDLSEQLVVEGLAWHYKQYSSDPRLSTAEQQARAARKGLWQDRQPISPSDWRHGLDPARSGNEALLATDAAAGPVHGNVKSRLYHLPGCPNYGCRNCTAIFADPSEAETHGYVSAGCCRHGPH